MAISILLSPLAVSLTANDWNLDCDAEVEVFTSTSSPVSPEVTSASVTVSAREGAGETLICHINIIVYIIQKITLNLHT